MKKQTGLLILVAALLITLSSSSFVLAKEGGKDEDKSNRSKVEIRVKNEVEEEQEGIEVRNDNFEIRGAITAVVGNNFTVAGQTIFLDPTQVNKFEQKGILATGKEVKVEGIIKNGVKFAREIKVLGDNQGRFKIATFATPQATSSANISVNVKANGTIDQVNTFLQQILNFLKSLIA